MNLEMLFMQRPAPPPLSDDDAPEPERATISTRVLELMRRRKESTPREAADELGISHTEACRVMRKLRDRGYIVHCGYRPRDPSGGARGAVWRLNER